MVEKGKDSTQEPMSTLAESGSDYSPAGLVSLGKNLLALLRDAALFVLALLLLVFPTSFNTVLTNAGFEEGSLAGFKWRGKLVASDSALKDAQATITKLKEQVDKSSQALHNAEAKVNDPVVKAELNKTEMENKQLDTASSKVQESVNTTINNSAPLVEKAQTSVSTNGPWGVVFSGDTT